MNVATINYSNFSVTLNDYIGAITKYTKDIKRQTDKKRPLRYCEGRF